MPTAREKPGRAGPHFAEGWRSVGLEPEESEANYEWHSKNLDELYQRPPAVQLSSPPRSYADPPPWKVVKDMNRAAKLATGQRPSSAQRERPQWNPSAVVDRESEPQTRRARPLSASRSRSAASLRRSKGKGKGQQRRPDAERRQQDESILRASYSLTEAQAQVYDRFASLLAQFDSAAMLDILEDVLHDAQDRTLLADYFGSED